ncbi:MAG: thioredoxin family protein [Mycoplasmataceae bacterium]|nr:thioredoxin family protein [Mycoplasmataceae bacterium]
MKRISFSTPNELSNFVEDSGHTLILFGRGWESTFIEVQNSLSMIKNEDIFPVNFCFASVIEYPTFFDEYKIKITPTMVIYKSGKEIWRSLGYQKYDFIKSSLERIVVNNEKLIG